MPKPQPPSVHPGRRCAPAAARRARARSHAPSMAAAPARAAHADWRRVGPRKACERDVPVREQGPQTSSVKRHRQQATLLLAKPGRCPRWRVRQRARRCRPVLARSRRRAGARSWTRQRQQRAEQARSAARARAGKPPRCPAPRMQTSSQRRPPQPAPRLQHALSLHSSVRPHARLPAGRRRAQQRVRRSRSPQRHPKRPAPPAAAV